ncbi:hypothetical protein RDI58_024495 [Solanum bulbocastanum]|uniref:Uncharacterized protein n=1 Tax=Solanum bulbocastanum TaxID=147425 RepID=A0AAN8Y3I9_SOLBU
MDVAFTNALQTLKRVEVKEKGTADIKYSSGFLPLFSLEIKLFSLRNVNVNRALTMAIFYMLSSEGQPPQMAGLDPSSSLDFPPLNTKIVSIIHTSPITSSFADIIKGHLRKDMIGKGKSIADVEPITQKKPNLVLDQPLMREVELVSNQSHNLQGGVEGVRSEYTHEPIKVGGKIEVTKVESGDNSASDKGPFVQMEDAMMIDVGVNNEVNFEIVRIEENNVELAHQQLSNEQLDKILLHVSFQITLQILEPKKKRKEKEHKNQDLEVVCFKSQPVQILHEIVSHQGAVEGQEMVNSSATENNEEKEVLQIEYKAFQEAGISLSSAITLRGKVFVWMLARYVAATLTGVLIVCWLG